MSLSWSVDQIKDYENVCWVSDDSPDREDHSVNRRLNPVTEALIFGTISVGLGSITDKNVDEFAARFRIIEKIHGPFLVKGGGDPWYLSDEDFISHIGLVCNVTNETRPKWASRIFVRKDTSVTQEIASLFVRARNRKEVSA